MASPGPGSTLSVEGQILSIDEGNKTRRLMIGFGAGASEVRTLTQVYEVTGGEHRLVDDFYTAAKSSRKPGLGPMSGAGAAAGWAATTARRVGRVALPRLRQRRRESVLPASALKRPRPMPSTQLARSPKSSRSSSSNKAGLPRTPPTNCSGTVKRYQSHFFGGRRNRLSKAEAK